MPDQRPVIVVIGLSAGGMPPLLNLIRGISADCKASIFIVQHIPAHAKSNLARILSVNCSLPIRNATHNLPINPGTVYTAISDHHLLVEEGRILVTKGPRENHWRPSIDTLFRSAAYAYRTRVIGVILSGALNDGTSGLWSIKQFGGIAISQSRGEALFDSMPKNAVEYVKIDHEVESKDLGPLIVKMSNEMMVRDDRSIGVHTDQDNFIKFEIGVAKGENALAGGVLEYGTFSPLTCPDCHGALTEYSEGSLRRYRCHTGHAHTAETLLAGIDANIETSIWEVMRGIEESQLLLNHLADSLESKGLEDKASSYRVRASELSERTQVVKSVILEQEAYRLPGQLDGSLNVTTDKGAMDY